MSWVNFQKTNMECKQVSINNKANIDLDSISSKEVWDT